MAISFLQRLARGVALFKGQRTALMAASAAVLVTAACEPLIPALLKPLLDRGFQGGSVALWMVPVIVLALFAVRGMANFTAQYSLAYATNGAMKKLRRRLFDKLMSATPALFATQSSSSLANTLVYEVQVGTSLLILSVFSFVRDSLTLLALMGYLFYLNWKLMLIVMVIFPSVAIVVRVLARRLQAITRASQSATDKLAYVVEENVLAHRVVRLHGAQQIQSGRFDELSNQLRRLAMKSTIAGASMSPITQLLAAAALSAVIVAALWEGSRQGITVGGFASFITAMLMMMAPIKHLSEVATPITRGLNAVERGLELLEQTPDESGGTHSSERARGHIEFDDVHVRYPNAARNALDGIDLDIQPGRAVALVGSSGSGKTTLVNLLPRFVDPSSGTVKLDGVPLSDWDLASLRRQFSFVSQDVVMFNDSIAANVALGLAPDRARVLRALEAANLGPYVQALPAGIDTEVGHNATQLSGGQRQRLAIARALYKDAPILVLDEATSALDTESEQAVKTALQRLMAGRTTLIVAHRLSTIEHADTIVVMSAGRIVETGSHAGLLRQGGAYARLHSQVAAGAEVSSPAGELLQ
ncbi:MAG: lipid export permease/ATP-binding protein MsbA [Ramlibacter sp.]|nr:lipid export permease/ATP-binding protein MsbA [Ramlibacter sp.]